MQDGYYDVVVVGGGTAGVIAGYAVEKSDSPQPSTYIYRLDGYDLASIDMQALKKA
jgi:cation diffusion facilitator CzcD-associated flavoprotein CzcO